MNSFRKRFATLAMLCTTVLGLAPAGAAFVDPRDMAGCRCWLPTAWQARMWQEYTDVSTRASGTNSVGTVIDLVNGWCFQSPSSGTVLTLGSDATQKSFLTTTYANVTRLSVATSKLAFNAPFTTGTFTFGLKFKMNGHDTTELSFVSTNDYTSAGSGWGLYREGGGGAAAKVTLWMSVGGAKVVGFSTAAAVLSTDVANGGWHYAVVYGDGVHAFINLDGVTTAAGAGTALANLGAASTQSTGELTLGLSPAGSDRSDQSFADFFFADQDIHASSDMTNWIAYNQAFSTISPIRSVGSVADPTGAGPLWAWYDFTDPTKVWAGKTGTAPYLVGSGHTGGTLVNTDPVVYVEVQGRPAGKGFAAYNVDAAVPTCPAWSTSVSGPASGKGLLWAGSSPGALPSATENVLNLRTWPEGDKTIFVVYNLPAESTLGPSTDPNHAAAHLLSNGGSAGGRLGLVGHVYANPPTPNDALVAHTNTGANGTDGGHINADTWNIYEVTHQPNQSLTLWANGFTSSANASTPYDLLNYQFIGRPQILACDPAGYIAHVVVYAGILDVPTRAAVRRWAKGTVGVSNVLLPASGPSHIGLRLGVGL